jgi:DNA-binding LytR/AlgR family response regulator
MNLKQSVPEYLTNRKNTIIQIAFTALFAYVFINIYLPFGADQWYNTGSLQFRFLSGVAVLLGMVVILGIRMLMALLQKKYEVTVAHYIWMIAMEVFVLGLFFTTIGKLVLKDERGAFQLMVNSTQNTALILLIPYLISSLFFAWTDIQKKMEQVITQFKDPSEVFVPFKDEKGKIRINLKLSDIVYLESNDNYVNIHFSEQQRTKTFMLRNTIKRLQSDIAKYPIIRCHRKYSVNKLNVQMLRKGKNHFEAVMKDSNKTVIPVSKSYQKDVMARLSNEFKES